MRFSEREIRQEPKFKYVRIEFHGMSLEFLPSERPYIIAEIGGNHGGDVDRAKEYVKAAAESGADAAKFQLYQAEHLIREDEPPLPLAGDDYDTQFERFKELELTREEWHEVIDSCRAAGIDFAASVFDREMLAFARDHVPFLKIASGDLTNIPLLRQSAATGKPIVLSTGFSTVDEIEAVVTELSGADLVLLHCVGCYPTVDADANLEMIGVLDGEFDVPVGYSDHTIGTLAPIASVTKGAHIVEKHFTLDKTKEVGDHRLSATPEELETIVRETERLAEMNGTPRGSEIYECEGEIRSNMRRSLAVRNSIGQGERITADDLTALRPSTGLSPLQHDEVIGQTATRDIEARELLYESDLEM